MSCFLQRVILYLVTFILIPLLGNIYFYHFPNTQFPHHTISELRTRQNDNGFITADLKSNQFSIADKEIRALLNIPVESLYSYYELCFSNNEQFISSSTTVPEKIFEQIDPQNIQGAISFNVVVDNNRTSPVYIQRGSTKCLPITLATDEQYTFEVYNTLLNANHSKTLIDSSASVLYLENISIFWYIRLFAFFLGWG
jgi:hypothetical protein